MKKILVSMIILILAISFSACSLLNGDAATSTQKDDAAQSGTPATDNTGADGQDTAENETSTVDSQTDSTAATGKTIKVSLYFATDDNSALKKEEREIQVINGAILKASILALIDGPNTEGLRQTIPKGTKIRGISIKDMVATVDLSKEFTQTNGVAEIVARLSIVNTLAEINGIEKVRLHIEGKELIGPSGMSLGDMSPALLDAEGNPVAGEVKMVTLYFADSEAMYVVAEKRKILLANDVKVSSGGDSLEKQVFLELMKGPSAKNLHATIPNGTKLLSINTKDGLCTINLSSEFIDNSPGGTASERMTLDSVVNSLTELDNVKKVQFLIDGKKREIYTHVIFNEPFSRNEASISK